MFGGIAFMLGGNMACGVIGEDLLVRLGAEDAEKALTEPHTRPMDFTGKPMKTTVYVDPAGTASDSSWRAGSRRGRTSPPRCRRSSAPRHELCKARYRLPGWESGARFGPGTRELG